MYWCVLKCIECVFPALYILHIRHTDWLSMAGHSQTNGNGRHPRLHTDPSQNIANLWKLWKHKLTRNCKNYPRLHTDPSTKHWKNCKINWEHELSRNCKNCKIYKTIQDCTWTHPQKTAKLHNFWKHDIYQPFLRHLHNPSPVSHLNSDLSKSYISDFQLILRHSLLWCMRLGPTFILIW